MAYREPTFNANILTDLLSTYLDQKSSEREKYYKAAEKASTPKTYSVGGNIVRLDKDGKTEILYKGEKMPQFKDFTKNGTTYQAQYMGEDYVQKEEDIKIGLPKFYQYQGFNKPAPNQPKKGKTSEIYKAVTTSVDKDIKRLLNIKHQKIDPYGNVPLFKWEDDPTHEAQLKFYKKVKSNPRKWIKENPDAQQPVYSIHGAKQKETPKKINEVRRTMPDGRIVIYDADTKQPLRFLDE